jgi:hypothetical protein
MKKLEELKALVSTLETEESNFKQKSIPYTPILK